MVAVLAKYDSWFFRSYGSFRQQVERERSNLLLEYTLNGRSWPKGSYTDRSKDLHSRDVKLYGSVERLLGDRMISAMVKLGEDSGSSLSGEIFDFLGKRKETSVLPNIDPVIEYEILGMAYTFREQNTGLEEIGYIPLIEIKRILTMRYRTILKANMCSSSYSPIFKEWSACPLMTIIDLKYGEFYALIGWQGNTHFVPN